MDCWFSKRRSPQTVGLLWFPFNTNQKGSTISISTQEQAANPKHQERGWLQAASECTAALAEPLAEIFSARTESLRLVTLADCVRLGMVRWMHRKIRLRTSILCKERARVTSKLSLLKHWALMLTGVGVWILGCELLHENGAAA